MSDRKSRPAAVQTQQACNRPRQQAGGCHGRCKGPRKRRPPHSPRRHCFALHRGRLLPSALQEGGRGGNDGDGRSGTVCDTSERHGPKSRNCRQPATKCQNACSKGPNKKGTKLRARRLDTGGYSSPKSQPSLREVGGAALDGFDARLCCACRGEKRKVSERVSCLQTSSKTSGRREFN